MDYNSSLKEVSLELQDIFLDPNNPRFSDNQRVIAEGKIIDDRIQKAALENMEKFDIESLIKNIEKNGFLKIDRIIVRKIKGLDNKYVVIEGNRRVASLKKILEDPADENLLAGIKTIDVLLYEGDNASITWFFQGIRHISGIKEWSPYQQAVLLEKTISTDGVGITEAGERYGIGRQISARLLRTLYALDGFKNDEEFGEFAKNEHFSMFEEILKIPTLREYFNWSDTEKKFLNLDKIRVLYQWIQESIISSAVDDVRRKLPTVLSQNDSSLIDDLTSKKISLEDLYIKITSARNILTEAELDAKFSTILKELDNLPSKFFTNSHEKERLSHNIDKLEAKILSLKKLLKP